MTDPYSKVRGKGIALLRRAGIQVDVGLREKEARQINAPFITQHTLGRPFIIAKWAQSLDGCIATSSGESQWISSAESRCRAQVLRGRVDAIVVGIRTALLDDPLLMARPKSGRQIKRIATRIILDSECRLPQDSQLVRTVAVAPVLVVHAQKLSRQAVKRREILQKKGVMMLGVPRLRPGLNLRALLKHLQTLEYTNILVEGGGEILGSFFAAGLVDEAQVFVAPMVIGGHNARHAIGGPDLVKLAQAHLMELMSIDRCGPDAHLVLRTTL
jgi:diaminohydroxyphosphoribosylaminopyrimidine deaminase/5-amino-6-(5-phosphoribosylamino)uracil reductase